MAFVFALMAFSPIARAAPPALPSSAPVAPALNVKAAFLSLPENERKAMQDGLGWLGFYNGVVDGAYGKRTIEALIAYQQSVAATADGVATPRQLAALKDAGVKAKAQFGFKSVDDPATGVRFAAPFKLLDKREGGASFTNLVSGDGQIGLYLKETSGDLAKLYKTMTSAPNRKVTYQYLKPDAFFVVAGEEGDKKFYRRYDAAPDHGKLRGFAFVYSRTRAKTLDPVALAIANGFEAFPIPAPATPLATPLATLAPPPAPEPARLTAVAFIVKPGTAVTTLPASQCRTPTIAGAAVQFLDAGNATGLTRIGGAFGAGAVSPPVADEGEDLVALSLAPDGESKAQLWVASAAPAPGSGTRQVLAALGPVATGAPLFDRQARLVGFMAPTIPDRRRADVALAQPRPLVSTAGVEAGDATPDQTAMSEAQIAARRGGAVVGLFCAP